MALTKIEELGSIPTPDAAFWNITDTVCDKNITNPSVRVRISGCIMYSRYNELMQLKLATT